MRIKHFDNIRNWSRKPSYWKDVKASIDGSESPYDRGLELIIKSQDYKPFKISSPFDKNKYEELRFYLATDGKNYYLVDSQGYDYVRNAVEIKNWKPNKYNQMFEGNIKLTSLLEQILLESNSYPDEEKQLDAPYVQRWFEQAEGFHEDHQKAFEYIASRLHQSYPNHEDIDWSAIQDIIDDSRFRNQFKSNISDVADIVTHEWNAIA